MALNPLIPTDERVTQTNDEPAPSKTYRLDFETGQVRRAVDGERSLRQTVQQILMTERFRHLIYSTDYGTELNALIHEDLPFEFLESEIPRVIREALEVDDRIDRVENIALDKRQDAVYVTFDVISDADWRLSFETEVVM